VTAELADGLSLEVTGPYASASGETGENLMLKAARALQAATSSQMGARLTLDKRLPVAAGIGGGSSDAAAVLRLLTLLWAFDPAHAAAAAPGLGGDVPVALEGVPALMRGEGEQIVPVGVKPLPAVNLSHSQVQAPRQALTSAPPGAKNQTINFYKPFIERLIRLRSMSTSSTFTWTCC
jgi:4-diphosphocytidyl-2C-methyl-D-erythritol kinase